MTPSNHFKQIAASTDSEREAYLDYAGWTDNPCAARATINEYAIPAEGTVADIASALRGYTGLVLIHSGYSVVGKTTFLQMLLDSLENSTTL